MNEFYKNSMETNYNYSACFIIWRRHGRVERFKKRHNHMETLYIHVCVCVCVCRLNRTYSIFSRHVCCDLINAFWDVRLTRRPIISFFSYSHIQCIYEKRLFCCPRDKKKLFDTPPFIIALCLLNTRFN